MNYNCRDSNGFALPLVLILLAFLSSLSFGLTRLVSSDMQIMQERKSSWINEVQTNDAVQEIVFRLLVGQFDELSVSFDGVRLPLNNQPSTVGDLTVRVQSWSGLYGLALLGHRNLAPVLEQVMDGKQAQQIAAELGDWTDADDRTSFRGLEAHNYAGRRLPQRPRNAHFRSVEELLELPSVTTQMMNGGPDQIGFRNLVLAGGDDNFDLGTAPELLVGPVLGLSGRALDEVLRARAAGDFSTVMYLIDENHWTFNDHPPFYKGQKYTVQFENEYGVHSRVQLSLAPYGEFSLYEIVEWNVPDYRHE